MSHPMFAETADCPKCTSMMVDGECQECEYEAPTNSVDATGHDTHAEARGER